MVKQLRLTRQNRQTGKMQILIVQVHDYFEDDEFELLDVVLE